MRKKNKLICLVISIFIIGIALYFFSDYKDENINNVTEIIVKSEIYNEKDIKDAMNIVKKKFKSEFKGCILTDLWYDENVSTTSADEWTKQYNVEEAIVLLSNFNVDSSGGDGSLNPNTTYTEWQWILVRDNSNNKWELKTWGY